MEEKRTGIERERQERVRKSMMRGNKIIRLRKGDAKNKIKKR